MSAVSSLDASKNTPIDTVASPKNLKEKILSNLQRLFRDGKNYVLGNKRAFANIGQVGGTAALVAGGAALLFSGVAANLTIGGIPLGIPLLAAGGILLAAGTILQVATYIEDKSTTVEEKIRGFFEKTLENIGVGSFAGVTFSAACATFSLSKLFAFTTKAIICVKILSDPEKTEAFLKKPCSIVEKVVNIFDKPQTESASDKNRNVSEMSKPAAVPEETMQQSEMLAVSMVPDPAV